MITPEEYVYLLQSLSPKTGYKKSCQGRNSAIYTLSQPCQIVSYFLICRLKDVQTLEELGDVYNHFLLYYGRDIPKMQNAAKANKKRLKKIRVSEDGKMRDDWMEIFKCDSACYCFILSVSFGADVSLLFR